MTLYRWFTEISGLGLTEQARKLMHPEAPKREEALAEAVDNWVERVRRFEAHGLKYALPALFKVTALRLMMVGRAKELFEIREAEHDTDEYGGFNDILNNVRDYARKEKLDHNVSKKDDMDCNQVAGGTSYFHEEWSWDLDAVGKGGKGKGGKGKGFPGMCFNCGEQEHQARFCERKGKGKGKDYAAPTAWISSGIKGNPKGKGKEGINAGFTGECFNCGNWGHSDEREGQEHSRSLGRRPGISTTPE
jgi:hypothetical protein